jgi:hypothetical protein
MLIATSIRSGNTISNVLSILISSNGHLFKAMNGVPLPS